MEEEEKEILKTCAETFAVFFQWEEFPAIRTDTFFKKKYILTLQI